MQMTETNQLFRYITSSIQDTQDKRLSSVSFDILEHLHNSLEELGFPFPRGFHSMFVRLGYSCLSRNLFIQYMNRGVFTIEEDFVEEVVNLLSDCNSPEDHHFKSLLINRLPLVRTNYSTEIITITNTHNNSILL